MSLGAVGAPRRNERLALQPRPRRWPGLADVAPHAQLVGQAQADPVARCFSAIHQEPEASVGAGADERCSCIGRTEVHVQHEPGGALDYFGEIVDGTGGEPPIPTKRGGRQLGFIGRKIPRLGESLWRIEVDAGRRRTAPRVPPGRRRRRTCSDRCRQAKRRREDLAHSVTPGAAYSVTLLARRRA